MFWFGLICGASALLIWGTIIGAWWEREGRLKAVSTYTDWSLRRQADERAIHVLERLSID